MKYNSQKIELFSENSLNTQIKLIKRKIIKDKTFIKECEKNKEHQNKFLLNTITNSKFNSATITNKKHKKLIIDINDENNSQNNIIEDITKTDNKNNTTTTAFNRTANYFRPKTKMAHRNPLRTPTSTYRKEDTTNFTNILLNNINTDYKIKNVEIGFPFINKKENNENNKKSNLKYKLIKPRINTTTNFYLNKTSNQRKLFDNDDKYIYDLMFKDRKEIKKHSAFTVDYSFFDPRLSEKSKYQMKYSNKTRQKINFMNDKCRFMTKALNYIYPQVYKLKLKEKYKYKNKDCNEE